MTEFGENVFLNLALLASCNVQTCGHIATVVMKQSVTYAQHICILKLFLDAMFVTLLLMHFLFFLALFLAKNETTGL